MPSSPVGAKQGLPFFTCSAFKREEKRERCHLVVVGQLLAPAHAPRPAEDAHVAAALRSGAANGAVHHFCQKLWGTKLGWPGPASRAAPGGGRRPILLLLASTSRQQPDNFPSPCTWPHLNSHLAAHQTADLSWTQVPSQRPARPLSTKPMSPTHPVAHPAARPPTCVSSTFSAMQLGSHEWLM